MPEQLFSEKEASEILQRAARIQEGSSDAEYAPGVTLAELTRIANEAGIDIKCLQAALSGTNKTESKTSFFNLAEEHETVINGEIDSDSMGEVLDALREKFSVSQLQIVGKSVQAQVGKGSVFGTLKLSSRRGRTRVSFKQIPFVAYFAGLHVPIILSIPLALGLAANHHPLPAILAPLGLLALGGTIFWKVAISGRRKARELFDMLGQELTLAMHQQQEPAKVEESENLQQRLDQH